jgi:hypothetical protein
MLTYIGAFVFFATGIAIAYFNYLGTLVMNQNEPYLQWVRMTIFNTAKLFGNPLVDLGLFSLLIFLVYKAIKRYMHEEQH